MLLFRPQQQQWHPRNDMELCRPMQQSHDTSTLVRDLLARTVKVEAKAEQADVKTDRCGGNGAGDGKQK